MRNKYLGRVMFLLLSIISLTSCSDSSEQISSSTENTVRLFIGGLNSRTSNDNLNASTIDGSVKVGAFGISEDKLITNGDNNRYSVSGANLIAIDGKEMTSLISSTVSVYAYAPYQEGWQYAQANSFTLPTNQSDDSGYLAADLLYATATDQDPAIANIELNFKHMFARLKVIFQTDENSVDITNASITITNTKIQTTFNPSSGQIAEATGSVEDINVCSQLGESEVVTAIILPQTISAGTSLVSISVGDKILIADLDQNVDFESGKSYNFTVKVGSNLPDKQHVKLQLGSTAVSPWEDESLGENPGGGEDPDPDDPDIVEGEILELNPNDFEINGMNCSWVASSNLYSWTGFNSNTLYLMKKNNYISIDNRYSYLNIKISSYSTTDDSYLTLSFYQNSNLNSTKKFTDLSGNEIKIKSNGKYKIDLTTDYNKSFFNISWGGLMLNAESNNTTSGSVKIEHVYFSSK